MAKIKIGMVDFFLDNWHTNHYPEYIREAAEKYEIDADLCFVYAETDGPFEWSFSTDGWCQHYGVERCNSYEELIEKSDAIMVMGADDCRDHERLAEKALKSGKPVYCDKTFAPSYEAAQRMVQLAKTSGTPFFSSSAQRFCPELQQFINDLKINTNGGLTADLAVTTGPGEIINYSIHQFEMLEAVMGRGFTKCTGFRVGETSHFVYEFGDGRMFTMTQAPGLPFSMKAGFKDSGCRNITIGDYYDGFFKTLLVFFENRIPPVDAEDTLEIMRMQQAARESVTW